MINLETFKQAIKISIRAIASNNNLEISFQNHQDSKKKLYLPEISKQLTIRDYLMTRGIGDSLALRSLLHNAQLHKDLRPYEKEAQDIFDAIEQVRYESIGALSMKGIAKNLYFLLSERYIQEKYNNITQKENAPLSEAIALIVREKLTKQPIPTEANSLVNLWRQWIEEKSSHYLKNLEEQITDQNAFSITVRKILTSMKIAEAFKDKEPYKNQYNTIYKQKETNSAQKKETVKLADENISNSIKKDEDNHETESDQNPSEKKYKETHSSEEARKRQVPGDLNHLTNYKIFTRIFDETIETGNLCEGTELAKLRISLDKQVRNLQGMVGRLANRLQRRLMTQQKRSWDFEREEGYIDRARLTRIITDPNHPLSYKIEKDTEFRDTVVSLLIDNSGSMRGRPITVAAKCADILTQTLERCEVKVEILGFTTKKWKGGLSRETWLREGKPTNPGRLNDLRHIIYKSADTPWRRARYNLGLMMKEGLLKENIDGEALIWAHQRLLNRREHRRILMMISDGAPVDDSTLSVNKAHYLEKHLRAVISNIEAYSPIELIAIGIGHDVTRYYRRAVTIIDAEELAGAMTEQLAALFEKKRKLSH
ncbi:MAG: Cobaltochelatase CobT subunit [Candidatus Tokpelaia sp. JSC161]|jgi:cobaltochelatase CobT|nr:MAG: Cobaltochelatase CobT subunit [Candidatus Tokpelaia sp. JSC161]